MKEYETMYIIGEVISKFQSLRNQTMSNKELDQSTRTTKTFIYDYASFALTTIYLSIANDIMDSYSDQFGFLSIGAQYQMYWTWFSPFSGCYKWTDSIQ